LLEKKSEGARCQAGLPIFVTYILPVLRGSADPDFAIGPEGQNGAARRGNLDDAEMLIPLLLRELFIPNLLLGLRKLLLDGDELLIG